MKSTRFRTAVALAFLAVPCAAEIAEPANLLEVPEDEAKSLSPQCNAGVVYDDGAFNVAYSIGDGDPGDATMVMKFDLPGGTTQLDQACFCFSRANSGISSSMSFDVVVYNDNGAGGQPGSLLGTASATATSLPIFGASQFYSVDLTSAGIVLPDTSVYVGARWPGGGPGGGILMCGDTSSGTTQRSNYGSGNLGVTWTSMSTLFPGNPPRAMGIRVDPRATAGTCTPTATAMCLNNNRFRVEATFQAAGQPVGNAQAVKLTDETGYLWFFSAVNVEAVIKVINACSYNNRFWVYAGGLTDVKVDITVTDTATGVPKVYHNPLGAPFQPIQDSSALATCP